jgi:hypothetical protein
MSLSKLLHVARFVLPLVVLAQISSAQGPLTNLETRAAAGAALWIGRSAVVQGVVKEVFGREAAEALLKLPPVELGWKVIGDDRLASAVANSTLVSRAGNTEGFLASINTLRAFETTQANTLGALQAPANLSSVQRLHLLSVAPSTEREEKVRSVVANAWLKDENSTLTPRATNGTSPNNVSRRSVSITVEGINIDPGYSVPLWTAKKTTGNLELNRLKWTDTAAGGALGCAVLAACVEGVSDQVKNIFETDQTSHH